MIKKALFILLVLPLFISSCGMMQSIVKSSFPYTATLVIPAIAETGKSSTAISLANSFDQYFSVSGNNSNNISEVSIISAELRSTEPAGYNIGNIKMLKIYMSKENGDDEVLVATARDIKPDAGNLISLDEDNAIFLDKFVRESNIRVKMVYELRRKVDADVSVHLVLNMKAYPAGGK